MDSPSSHMLGHMTVIWLGLMVCHMTVTCISSGFPANVEYEEIDIAADDIPSEQLSLLPYASFSPRQKGTWVCNVLYMVTSVKEC